MSNYLNQIEKLNNSNYQIWKVQMEMILIQLELSDFISTNNPTPNQDTPEYHERFKKDKKALATIILGIQPSLIIHVKKCVHALDCWTTLNRHFEPKGPTRRIKLIQNLITIKLDKNVKMQDHLNKYTEIIDQLNEIEASPPEDFLKILLLCSLTDTYDSFRCAMETRDELPSLENNKIKFLQEEDRKMNNNHNEDEEAMVSHKQKNEHTYDRNKSNTTNNITIPKKYTKNKKNPCQICKKSNHNTRDYFNKYKPKDKAGKVETESNKPDNNDIALTIKQNLNFQNKFYIDSGATSNMSYLKNHFITFNPVKNQTIKVADNRKLPIKGKGTIRIKTLINGEEKYLTLQDTLYIPKLKRHQQKKGKKEKIRSTV